MLDSWHWYTAGDNRADLLSLKASDVVAVDLNDAPNGVAVVWVPSELRVVGPATVELRVVAPGTVSGVAAGATPASFVNANVIS